MKGLTTLVITMSIMIFYGFVFFKFYSNSLERTLFYSNKNDNASVYKASVENSVLLKCRKLRREYQETSDWVVNRILFIENPSCW